MRTQSVIRCCLGVLLGLILASQTSYGGSYQRTSQGVAKRWKANTAIPYVVNPGGVPGLTGTLEQLVVLGAVNDSFRVWTQTPAASIAFTSAGTTQQTNALIDGINLVSFQDTNFVFPPGVLAVALVVSASGPGPVQLGSNVVNAEFAGEILDVDIVFNPQPPNGTFFSPLGVPGSIDLVAVAEHEIGHLLGLDHSGVFSSIMNPFSESGSGVANRIVQSDDLITVAGLYPAASFATDRGTISGTVVSSTGAAVKSAHVVAVSNPGYVPVASQLTGTDGSYQITGLPPGNYLVLVEPLDGPISLVNFGSFYSNGQANFATTFLGSLATPTSVAATAGQTTTANVVLPATPASPLNVNQWGLITPVEGGTLFTFGSSPRFLPRGKSYQFFAIATNQTSDSNLTFAGSGITGGATTGGVLPNGEPFRKADITIGSTAALGPSNVFLSNPTSASALAGGVVATVNPSIQANGITNGASFGTTLAPGTLVSIFGNDLAGGTEPATLTPLALPTSLGGVSVKIGDRLAPLQLVSPSQINALIPFELPVAATAVTILTGPAFEFQGELFGAVGNTVTVNLSPTAPGLFALNGSGSGQGEIRNGSDGSPAAPVGSVPNARPALPGETVQILAAGLGAVTPTFPSGLAAGGGGAPIPTTVSTPTVSIGGLPATVVFSGLANALVGYYQVNVQVPAAAPTGDAVPVTLTIGGVTSNTVTMAIGSGTTLLPDLTISMTDSPDPVISGGTVTYTITVQNIGVASADAVTVTDTLPANVTIVSCTCGTFQVSGTTVTVNLGTLAAGMSTGFDLLIRLFSGTSENPTFETNTAAVTTTSTEASTTNNSASVTTTVNPTTPITPQGGGPPGGFVGEIAIDPVSPDTVYVGTVEGGVFKSTNGGTSWTAVNSGITSFGLQVHALAIDPSTPATLYAGTSGGVFKSTNGGTSWTAVNSGLTSLGVSSIAIDPSNPAVLYAANSRDGVFKSTNGGANWSAVTAGLTDLSVSALALDPSNPATLYATTFSGLFKTIDGGTSWTVVNTGFGTPIFTLAVDPSNPATLYAGTSGRGVFKTTNGGASWAAINSGLTATTVTALAIDPSNPATLYAGTYSGGVFKSTDGGVSWNGINVGLTSLDVEGLAIDPANTTIIYVATRGGIFKTTDGGQTWTAINSGIAVTNVEALAIDQTSPATVYAGTASGFGFGGGGVSKSNNGGLSWAIVNSGLTATFINALAIDATSPTTLYAGTSTGGVFKSTNGGANWVAVNSGLATLSIQALAIDPDTPTTLYAATGYPTIGGSGVFKSTNGGASWSAVNSGLTTLNGFIDTLVIDPTNPATLYAGTTQGAGVGVFKSTNGGASWTATSLSQGVNVLAIDPANPGTLYTGTDLAGVFKSTDGGANWTTASAGITASSIQAFAIESATPTTLYAGTFRGGVFKSTNGGASWTAVNSGLPATVWVKSLAIDPVTPSTLYAGTAGFGVFKSRDGGATWQPTGANELTYMVGDVSPLVSASGDLNGDGDTDDLGEFGNDALSTTDLIIALRAVTNLPGWRPPTCSDRFDVMDSSPADTDTTRGGSGTLTTTDLIITLRRVTGIDLSRPRRPARGLACP